MWNVLGVLSGYGLMPTGKSNGYFDWNSDYCKGCGIRARECPKEAIQMVAEEE